MENKFHILVKVVYSEAAIKLGIREIHSTFSTKSEALAQKKQLEEDGIFVNNYLNSLLSYIRHNDKEKLLFEFIKTQYEIDFYDIMEKISKKQNPNYSINLHCYPIIYEIAKGDNDLLQFIKSLVTKKLAGEYYEYLEIDEYSNFYKIVLDKRLYSCYIESIYNGYQKLSFIFTNKHEAITSACVMFTEMNLEKLGITSEGDLNNLVEDIEDFHRFCTDYPQCYYDDFYRKIKFSDVNSNTVSDLIFLLKEDRKPFYLQIIKATEIIESLLEKASYQSVDYNSDLPF